MLDQIPHGTWKRDMQVELYSFMIAPPKLVSGESSPDPFCADREVELLERPTKKLKTILRNERLTLLGLAVWKAICLCQMPPAYRLLCCAKVVHLRLEKLQSRPTRFERHGHCRLGSSILSRLVPSAGLISHGSIVLHLVY
jgi:hypothetical protein